MEEIKKTRSTKESIFLSCYVFVPMFFTANAGEYFTDDFGMRVLYNGILGLLGALFGYGLYYLTRNRSTPLRVIVLIVFIIVLAFAFNRLREKFDGESETELVILNI